MTRTNHTSLIAKQSCQRRLACHGPLLHSSTLIQNMSAIAHTPIANPTAKRLDGALSGLFRWSRSPRKFNCSLPTMKPTRGSGQVGSGPAR
ncbi:uncharacterized protein CANTADRAFT_26916 [Suhomyces tanzawaensis NRRL Y-17324]|uniref:Uncharacterized protein n=1 Tax=Suhomyces tanzawaensis NRRL Y-17324 TaxID=984487 RepID=A0A1E4SEL3_9ASCO|nr:uncharacterized protein CANTADRAFT_26916 [Suhomyces tanzawaensis NRRL Y-17324]ODV77923.1 hypothetical protein CANTADRAFT_26916 [Suhomyces tanzawaensis NRRL Y-17324]